jgi:hypothetical protein
MSTREEHVMTDRHTEDQPTDPTTAEETAAHAARTGHAPVAAPAEAEAHGIKAHGSPVAAPAEAEAHSATSKH